MVFRGADVEGKGVVNWHDFASFLKDVLRKFMSKSRVGFNVCEPDYECA